MTKERRQPKTTSNSWWKSVEFWQGLRSQLLINLEDDICIRDDTPIQEEAVLQLVYYSQTSHYRHGGLLHHIHIHHKLYGPHHSLMANDKPQLTRPNSSQLMLHAQPNLLLHNQHHKNQCNNHSMMYSFRPNLVQHSEAYISLTRINLGTWSPLQCPYLSPSTFQYVTPGI